MLQQLTQYNRVTSLTIKLARYKSILLSSVIVVTACAGSGPVAPPTASSMSLDGVEDISITGKLIG